MNIRYGGRVMSGIRASHRLGAYPVQSVVDYINCTINGICDQGGAGHEVTQEVPQETVQEEVPAQGQEAQGPSQQETVVFAPQYLPSWGMPQESQQMPPGGGMNAVQAGDILAPQTTMAPPMQQVVPKAAPKVAASAESDSTAGLVIGGLALAAIFAFAS